MFTGIIEEVGLVAEVRRSSASGGGTSIVVRARQILSRRRPLRAGDSIAVDGVCLTATKASSKSFSADLSPETLERTSLTRLVKGLRVNLERPMTPSSRFGGHIVQGHVDGVGKLVALEPLRDGNYWLSVDIPLQLARYVVEKGSVAINGISLTVARIDGNRLGVAIIPYTYSHTALADLCPGDLLNIECDVLAKYVERLLTSAQAVRLVAPTLSAPSSLTLERFLEEGF